jgi:hypothetical protein
MAVVTGVIEYLVPWTSDLPVFATPWNSSWPPILSGAIIGSLQVTTNRRTECTDFQRGGDL